MEGKYRRHPKPILRWYDAGAVDYIEQRMLAAFQCHPSESA